MAKQIHENAFAQGSICWGVVPDYWDGNEKDRPLFVVLSSFRGDVILAGITTKFDPHKLGDKEIIVPTGFPTNLDEPCVIITDWLVCVHASKLRLTGKMPSKLSVRIIADVCRSAGYISSRTGQLTVERNLLAERVAAYEAKKGLRP